MSDRVRTGQVGEAGGVAARRRWQARLLGWRKRGLGGWVRDGDQLVGCQQGGGRGRHAQPEGGRVSQVVERSGGRKASPGLPVPRAGPLCGVLSGLVWPVASAALGVSAAGRGGMLVLERVVDPIPGAEAQLSRWKTSWVLRQLPFCASHQYLRGRRQKRSQDSPGSWGVSGLRAV